MPGEVFLVFDGIRGCTMLSKPAHGAAPRRWIYRISPGIIEVMCGIDQASSICRQRFVEQDDDCKERFLMLVLEHVDEKPRLTFSSSPPLNGARMGILEPGTEITLPGRSGAKLSWWADLASIPTLPEDLQPRRMAADRNKLYQRIETEPDASRKLALEENLEPVAFEIMAHSPDRTTHTMLAAHPCLPPHLTSWAIAMAPEAFASNPLELLLRETAMVDRR